MKIHASLSEKDVVKWRISVGRMYVCVLRSDWRITIALEAVMRGVSSVLSVMVVVLGDF